MKPLSHQPWICLISNQPQPTTRCRRSLLPFLGTALSWLMGTATTKDICSIRTRINQIIATQFSQCDTLVHIVSILNVTRYATQVNRHSINSLIDAIHSTAQDINNPFQCNIIPGICKSLEHHEISMHQYPHIPWTTLMLPHLASCHPMSCQLQTYSRCWNTSLPPCHLPYTYLFRQWIPCISTGTWVHMSSLKTNISYY